MTNSTEPTSLHRNTFFIMGQLKKKEKRNLGSNSYLKVVYVLSDVHVK